MYAVTGTYFIEAKLDTGKILPKDTPIRKPNRLLEEIGAEIRMIKMNTIFKIFSLAGILPAHGRVQ